MEELWWTLVTLGAACVPRNGIIGARTSPDTRPPTTTFPLSIRRNWPLHHPTSCPFSNLRDIRTFPRSFTRLTNQRQVSSFLLVYYEHAPTFSHRGSQPWGEIPVFSELWNADPFVCRASRSSQLMFARLAKVPRYFGFSTNFPRLVERFEKLKRAASIRIPFLGFI